MDFNVAFSMRAHLCPLAVVLCFFGFPFCADFNHKSGLRFCRPAHHPHSSRPDHQRRRGKYDPGSKSWNFTARKTPRAKRDLSSKYIKYKTDSHRFPTVEKNCTGDVTWQKNTQRMQKPLHLKNAFKVDGTNDLIQSRLSVFGTGG